MLLPIVAGAGLLISGCSDRRKRQIYVASVVAVNMLITLGVIFFGPKEELTLIRFSEGMSLAFRVDGLSSVFGTMVSVLWTVTTFYSFEYMKHEGKETKFFSFFTMSFGVVVGLSFAANMLTFYLFYELLTLATLPLVMHAMDDKARSAGKKYLIYSMSGAAFAFIAMIFISQFGSLDFVMGGTLAAEKISGYKDVLLTVYLLGFMGFGVKAAVFPLHGWLPSASVAPTPVSALLHAVAVVKAGVFAIIRLTYYCFGTEFLYGTWVQYVVMGVVIFTIVFGSTMALRTSHFKRRLAYSTVSNLSYILFGVVLMTPAGLVGGLIHMIFHAVIKITLFFCAGAVLYKTHHEYVYTLEGFGKAMPVTMLTFAISSLGLIGVPPFAGFTSKWQLATAAVETGNPLAYVGIAALIISALLTALYLLSVVITAYFPKKDFRLEQVKDVADPNRLMTVPLTLLTAASVVLAVFPAPLINIFQQIAAGLF